LDLPWNDERSNQFITNGGLITSDDPFRANVMAYEWTHYISYYVYYISKENTIGDHTTFVEVIKDSNNFLIKYRLLTIEEKYWIVNTDLKAI